MPRLSAAQIAQHARAAGWSGADVAIATAVALAESGGNTDAVNTSNRDGSADYGLWQINSVHNPTAQNWRDPAVNARMAHGVWQRQGWGIVGRPGQGWTAYSTGAYKLHLPAATAAAGNPFGLEGRESGGDNPLVPDALEGTQDAAKAALGYVDATVKWMRDPHNWERVAKVVLGGALLLAGLRVAVQPAVSGAVGAVGSVLPVGKVSSSIGKVTK